MNLTQAGLSTSFSLDATNRQLSNSAVSNVSFDPTSKARVSAHETDRQAEDNATWYFEYRALLNSKLTTLITSLTSAYTTDMDASMGEKNPAGGTKNSMQGLTGYVPTGSPAGTRPFVDPGAARTAVSYLSKFGTGVTETAPSGAAIASSIWAGTDALSASLSDSVSVNFLATPNPNTPAITASSLAGTTTFLSGGGVDFLLDTLHVNMDPYNNTPDNTNTTRGMGPTQGRYNYYDNLKTENLSSYTRDKNDSTDVVKNQRAIGNNLEFTLYKFFERPENLDLIRFGFFKDVYVVATSSLPTGSQVQGSLSMDWDAINGRIKIKQERYAAFFHS